MHCKPFDFKTDFKQFHSKQQANQSMDVMDIEKLLNSV